MHPAAHELAKVAECAARRGKFWEAHDFLFNHQADLSHGLASAEVPNIGLTETELSICLENPDIEASIGTMRREAERLHVTSTPAFFVGTVASSGDVVLTRRINGAYPYAVFQDVIRQLVQKGSKTN
jgi:protein-disulfide isomerase